MPSWIIRQPAMRRWHDYAPLAASCLRAPAVAFADRKFDSPSGKVEFYSSQAERRGLPPLPVHDAEKASPYPLVVELWKGTDPPHAFYAE